MKNKASNEQAQAKKQVELDQETIADLEVDDHDADLLKGGASQKCPKGGDGGGTSILVQ